MINKEQLKFSMDNKLSDGVHTPGSSLMKEGFNWKFFDMTNGFECMGTRGRMDHAYYLFKYASLLPDNSLIVEIGTYQGLSAVVMAMGLMSKNKDTKSRIITIDPGLMARNELEKKKKDWKYELIEQDILRVLNNFTVANVDHLIEVIPDTSENVFNKWITDNNQNKKDTDNNQNKKGIDMLYVDGSHRYEDVKTDCKWMELVKKGRFAVFDDWIEGVERAVFEYTNDHREWEVITMSTNQPPGYPWKTTFWKN